MNSGFVAFDVDRWPWLLQRWIDVNGRIPLDKSVRPDPDPYRDHDQDALNAILMSEVDSSAVLCQPAWAHAHRLNRAVVVDRSTLACADQGRPVTILHHSGTPKVWESSGWQRDFRQAYVRLLRRVLCSEDVALRLQSDDLPVWLRPTRSGRLSFYVLSFSHAFRAAKSIVRQRLHWE